MSTQEDLAKASQDLGEAGAKLDLLKKTGKFKDGVTAAETADDVVGFDYLTTNNGKCYAFYTANPPLIGMSKPTPTPCPVGIAVFGDTKVDYKQAIDIFHKGNWGSKFTSIVISKPLTPSVNDPFWYIKSELGTEVVINANTGEVQS